MSESLPVLVVVASNADSCVSNAIRSQYDVRIASCSEDAISLAARTSHVQACAVDISLGDRTCATLIGILLDRDPGLPVFLLTPHAEFHAPLASARGVERIVAPLEPRALSAALERLERRALAFVGRALKREFDSRTAYAQLTPQQAAVSWMSVLGATAKEVAATRGLAVRTVETHRYEVLKKLNLATTDALRWELLARVLPPWRRK